MTQPKPDHRSEADQPAKDRDSSGAKAAAPNNAGAEPDPRANSDAETLARIAFRAYQHMAPWTVAQFDTQLADPHSLLILRDTSFVLARVVAGEAEILALATDPAGQRQGAASAVLESFHAQARLRGAEHAFLEVAETNIAARAFYSARAYVQVGQRRGYYVQPGGADPVDALILSRAL